MSDTPAPAEARWDADIALPAPRANRPATRMHRLEASLAAWILERVGRMPVEKAALRLGGLLSMVGPMILPVHRRGHRNLRLIYPDMTAAERSAILRGAWRNIGMTVAEFAHLKTLPERVTVIHGERLDEIIEKDAKAVFFSGHFANWEAMAVTLFAHGIRYGVVYRPANNPYVDKMIIEHRAAAMSRRQIPKGKKGARELLQTLKDGLSLCLLTDQKLNDGIEAPLLGLPAMTTQAAARLALSHDVPLIPLQIVRQPGSRFTLTVHEPLRLKKSENDKQDVAELTAMMNERLGDFILERPDQWLWFHRRWPSELAG
ncbi:hypothetical protein PB2503_13159 [Parvularcula bermudensis HTCC2503]|uniref:Lipid A biosynthesis lauroyl acyltransferase n=1 Tax=Parvularcula bermudensis (strain ATCC BAA-594 / HTCC2503 / KCTC 12087) TaxID=314260 RepID=E0TGR0_PARBH|nr:lysophospholipid acyltransferase family protein [Parvularcula bermudensis]ADM10669.1 hypothetical protein PB2503_13159 [Parvularcula bermudensis HTCC2503]